MQHVRSSLAPRRLARFGSLLGSLLLGLALAFAPVQSRGLQAELFALLAFFLLVGTASAAVPVRRAR
jgi:hypothetical protein